MPELHLAELLNDAGEERWEIPVTGVTRGTRVHAARVNSFADLARIELMMRWT